MDQNTPIDAETQKKLNTPLAHPGGLATEDEKFLNVVLSKVEAKQIDLYRPSSLINDSVYNQLSEDKKGKVDYDAVNLATTLRTMCDLWKYYQTPTYQIEYLVRQVRITKERLEEISGDVYVI